MQIKVGRERASNLSLLLSSDVHRPADLISRPRKLRSLTTGSELRQQTRLPSPMLVRRQHWPRKEVQTMNLLSRAQDDDPAQCRR